MEKLSLNARLRVIRNECRDDIEKAKKEYDEKLRKAEEYKDHRYVELRDEAKAEYQEKCEPIRSRAKEQEEALFEEARKATEGAMVKAPSVEQLAYLQTLSMRTNLTEDDLNQAARMMEGNAMAEATLEDLAEKHGLDGRYRSFPHSFTEIMNGLDELERHFKSLTEQFMSSGAENPHREERLANIDFALDDDRDVLCAVEEACSVYSD